LAVTSELVRRRGDLQFVEDDIAAELRLSRAAAAARLAQALDLDRLPAVAAALATGQLDLPKARAIAEAVGVLDQAAPRTRSPRRCSGPAGRRSGSYAPGCVAGSGWSSSAASTMAAVSCVAMAPGTDLTFP
jgi:Domain of unknown function (DUF222)